MAFNFPLLNLFFLIGSVSAELLLEDGYNVITAIDGHKLRINPYYVLPHPGSSDLIILDHSNSTFYSVSFPISEGLDGSSVNRLSGDGVAGHLDGESGRARFNKPRSFAVDAKGNVYVADQKNHAIRKISISGTVTTIAGGYSNKTGSADGPAQNATFSDDFDLIFIPERCVLLIADHGNQLIRQIDLKVNDCRRSSHSALGATSVWFLGLGLSCLLGIAIGVAIRPYIIPREGSSILCFSKTWKHCLIHLGKRILMCCSDIRSAIAKSMIYTILRKLFWLCLSHLSLMLTVNNVNSKISPSQHFVSLLDSDYPKNYEVKSSDMVSDELKDLLSLDCSQVVSNVSNEIIKGDAEQEENNVLGSSHLGRIDRIIEANVNGLTKTTEKTVPPSGPLFGTCVKVQRK